MQMPGSDAAPQDDLWQVLDQLAGQEEKTLRVILRPHEQSAFSWKKDADTIDLRNRLDRALGALTRFEIDTQTGRCVSADSRTLGLHEIPLEGFPARASLLKLFRSEAFLNYCDTYLYFGIRFLAQRFLSAETAAQGRLAESAILETAWRPFALMSPPALRYEDPALAARLSRAAADFFQMVKQDPIVEEPAELHPATEEMAALLFLDGFLDNPVDFELWLRGLLPATDQSQLKRLETISAGMRSWIQRRVDFYIEFADPQQAISAQGNEQ